MYMPTHIKLLFEIFVTHYFTLMNIKTPFGSLEERRALGEGKGRERNLSPYWRE